MLVATLGVDGRTCAAVALPGSAIGTVNGLVVVAESERALSAAEAWLPGRILVLSDRTLPIRVIDALIAEARATTFSAIVVLCDVDAPPALRGGAGQTMPMVAVTRPADQDWIRRAVRVTVSVQRTPAPGTTVPLPRSTTRRRAAASAARGVPGTIDLRAPRSEWR